MWLSIAHGLVGVILIASALGDATATIRITDTAAITAPADETPTLSGKTMAVVVATPAPDPSGVPPSGIDYFFSPQLQAAIQDTRKSACQVVNSDCQRALADTIDSRSVGIVGRQIVSSLVIGAIVVGVLSHIIASLILVYGGPIDRPVPYVHIAPDVVSQITAASTATVIAVATGTDAPIFTITATVAGARPTLPPDQIPTEGIDNKEDIHFTLPADLASNLQAAILEGSSCPVEHPNIKAFGPRPDPSCLQGAGVNTLLNARRRGMFSGLAQIPHLQAPLLRVYTDTDHQDSDGIVAFAGQIADSLALDRAAAEEVGRLVFALTYHAIKEGQALGPEIIMKHEVWQLPALPIEPFPLIGCSSETAESAVVTCVMRGQIQVCTSVGVETTECGAADTTTTAWGPLPTYNRNAKITHA